MSIAPARVFVLRSLCLLSLVGIIGSTAVSTAAQNCAGSAYPGTSWPAVGGFRAYTSNGLPLGDNADSGGANGDFSYGQAGGVQSQVDVTGGTCGSAVYFGLDKRGTSSTSDDLVFFRMRLRGNPMGGGNNSLQSGTWNTLIDTDGDGFKEFFVEVAGGNDPTVTVYYSNRRSQSVDVTAQSATDCITFQMPVVAGTLNNSGNAPGQNVWVVKDSPANPDGNPNAPYNCEGYLLTWQVPLCSFQNCAGTQLLQATTPFALAWSTSSTKQDPTQKDFVGTFSYRMGPDVPMPTGDLTTFEGATITGPRVNGVEKECQAGNSVLLRAFVQDTLTVDAGVVVDTIDRVQFFYISPFGGSPVQIGGDVFNPDTSGSSTLLGQFSTVWDYTGLPAGNYTIRVVAFDTSGNSGFLNGVVVNTANCAAAVTYSLLQDAEALALGDGGVLVKWSTATEADNLGFNVYREANGRRQLVTPHPVAGTVLLAGPGAEFRAGHSYAWFDAGGTPGSRYFIEDIDLKGATNVSGPVAVGRTATVAEAREPRSMTLADDIFRKSDADTSRELEVFAAIPAATPGRTATFASKTLGVDAALKIPVTSSGWYRLTAQDFARSGIDLSVDPSKLQLFVDGREIPCVVTVPEGSRDLSGATLQFYGVGVDAPSTNARVYWLLAGSRPGRRVAVAAGRTGTFTRSSFPASVEWRERSFYFLGAVNGEKENFFGAVISGQPTDVAISTPHLDAKATGSAQIAVSLYGLTTSAHLVSVRVNGSDVGTISYSGDRPASATFQVPVSILQSGSNSVSLVGVASPSSDLSLLESIRITYPRSFVAQGDALRFEATAGERVVVTGFSSSAIRVLDVTDPDNAKAVLATVAPDSGGGFAVDIARAGLANRTLYAFADTAVVTPASVAVDRPSTLRSRANAAEYLVIAPASMLEAVQPLLDLRRAQGRTVMAVDVEDIYDEFAFGLKSANAIRSFLTYASANWQTRPRFVVLVGDATVDPKNYLGRGANNDLVPTKLIDLATSETVSDDWFTDFDADGVANIALGRLPVRAVQELETVVKKIVAYESTVQSPGALLVFDRFDGYDFPAEAPILRAAIPATAGVEEIQLAQVASDEARRRIVDSINQGQAVVDYAGHGNLTLWRGNVLTSADAAQLQNGDRLAFFAAMTCFNGYFADYALESLAEALIKAPNGGAIAVCASSARTEASAQATVNRSLIQILYAGERRPATFGEIVLRAKQTTTNADVRRTFLFFGDPAGSPRW